MIASPGQTPRVSRGRVSTASTAASDIDLPPTLNPRGARHACGLVRALRRFSFVLSLAGTRLWRRLPRVLLAALGIAAGAAALATVLGAGAVAQDHSLARALPTARALRARRLGHHRLHSRVEAAAVPADR